MSLYGSLLSPEPLLHSRTLVSINSFRFNAFRTLFTLRPSRISRNSSGINRLRTLVEKIGGVYPFRHRRSDACPGGCERSCPTIDFYPNSFHRLTNPSSRNSFLFSSIQNAGVWRPRSLFRDTGGTPPANFHFPFSIFCRIEDVSNVGIFITFAAQVAAPLLQCHNFGLLFLRDSYATARFLDRSKKNASR